jgi:DNA-directed RNA polymerase specialized sigma24 family protein
VELRFFVGLTVEETAQALKISPKTVTRDRSLARLAGEGPMASLDK